MKKMILGAEICKCGHGADHHGLCEIQQCDICGDKNCYAFQSQFPTVFEVFDGPLIHRWTMDQFRTKQDGK